MTLKVPRINTEQITLEHLVLALIIVGLPLIGLMWFGWRAAATVLILTLIGLGLVKLRVS
jgi:uncharacterized membrane protein YfbV (UPF0208 family)